MGTHPLGWLRGPWDPAHSWCAVMVATTTGVPDQTESSPSWKLGAQILLFRVGKSMPCPSAKPQRTPPNVSKPLSPPPRGPRVSLHNSGTGAKAQAALRASQRLRAPGTKGPLPTLQPLCLQLPFEPVPGLSGSPQPQTPASWGCGGDGRDTVTKHEPATGPVRTTEAPLQLMPRRQAPVQPMHAEILS